MFGVRKVPRYQYLHTRNIPEHILENRIFDDAAACRLVQCPKRFAAEPGCHTVLLHCAPGAWCGLVFGKESALLSEVAVVRRDMSDADKEQRTTLECEMSNVDIVI